MTLADMARKIEERLPDTLPKSLYFVCDGSLAHKDDRGISAWLNDDLAAAILRDAMVIATKALRDDKGWWIDDPMGSWFDVFFRDADHGNDPTRSLFAAFCAAYPSEIIDQ